MLDLVSNQHLVIRNKHSALRECNFAPIFILVTPDSNF